MFRRRLWCWKEVRLLFRFSTKVQSSLQEPPPPTAITVRFRSEPAARDKRSWRTVWWSGENPVWTGPCWSCLVLTEVSSVCRVEQQLMSRMISEIYQPALPEPAHNQLTDQSELLDRSPTSNIGEKNRPPFFLLSPPPVLHLSITSSCLCSGGSRRCRTAGLRGL